MLVAALIGLASFSPSLPESAEQTWNARIRVIATDESVAGRAAALERNAPLIFGRCAERLGLPLPERIEILLAPSSPRDRLEAERLGIAVPPVWAAGLAIPSKGQIVIFADRVGTYPHEGLPGVLAHEASHLVLGGALEAGQRVPRWYDEGLAMVVERELSLVDAVELARLLVFGEPLPLAAIDRGWPREGALARRAYAQSLSIVSLAEETAAPGAAGRTVRALGEGVPFDRAFTRAYGVSPRVVEALWRDRLRQRLLIRPLLVLAALAQGAMGVLAILAWIRVRRRKRLRLEKMRIQEELEELSRERGPSGLSSGP
jgi:hypothetical protein